MRQRVVSIAVLLITLCSMGWGTASAVTCASTTTSCPYTTQDLESFTNNTPFYDASELPQVCGSDSTGSTTLVGNDPTQQAFNFFIQKGLTVTQTAAVIGNLTDEAHLDPTALQKGGESKNPNDAGTSGLDGWGIAQWSPGGKVIDIAKSYNISGNIYELGPQLQIVWAEMSGPNAIAPTGYKDIVHDPVFSSPSSSLSDLVTDFQNNFEHGVPGTRQRDAVTALKQYGGGAATTANSGSTASSNCSDTAANCSQPASGVTSTTSSLSQVRQNVVCLSQAELSYWKQQPGYTNSYPGFSFAATGFLKYTDQNYEEWCADFASWIYKQAGYPFSGGTSGGWRLPAVTSIEGLGQAEGKFHWHAAGSGYIPKPGDLAIRNGHVNIFISASGGITTYIGGDQRGVNEPNGTYGTKNPASGSIVSTETNSGFYSEVLGYVSPD